MKNIFSLLTLLTVSLFLSVGVKAQTLSGPENFDKKSGFRNARLETPFTAFKNMKPIGKDFEWPENSDFMALGVKYYTRTTDKLTFESETGEDGTYQEYALRDIVYGFYQGKLMHILVIMDNRYGYKFEDAIMGVYGHISYLDDTSYAGKTKKARFKRYGFDNRYPELATYVFESIALHKLWKINAAKAEQQAEAKKAAERLNKL